MGYCKSYSRRYSYGCLDIDIDEDAVIDSLTTEKLVKTVAQRRKQLLKDPKNFEKDENWRKDYIESVSLDLDEYDLMFKADESLEHFDDEQIVEYLQKRGYTVTDENVDTFVKCLPEVCSDYLFNHTKFKNKDFLLNMLGLSSYATKADIVNRIGELID